MPDSLTSSPVRPLLDRLFQAAYADDTHWAAIRERHPDGFAGLTAREQADAYAELYIPVSPEGGRLLYTLVRASRPATVVEFGTSYGISTIDLATREIQSVVEGKLKVLVAGRKTGRIFTTPQDVLLGARGDADARLSISRNSFPS